ncbi:MAG TPA: bifunctional diguanylate cyclase/phosphodiesterase, partial [Epsilonproteobacteria bacterium]|nr:bifunctional diguanylate cyclase/phosphodiesterase [Campylobacterota bacterium]
DSLGHEIGDKVLRIIALRLQSIIRKEDTLARLSGDEFTIIVSNFKEKKDASHLAEIILEILAEPIHIDREVLYVSGSIGIAIYPDNALDAEYLLKYADTAMYNAKEEGRNTYKFYTSEMTESALAHMSMKTALRQAIDNEEFFIHYQPQIETVNNMMVGLEALIRWDHPTRGILYPSSFIALAEETGLIVEIDRWIMKCAMKQISQWYAEGFNPGILALNLSIKQLEGNGFIQELKDNLEKFSFKAEWLELEITERQMMKKPDDVIAKLREINALGIGISIDDFGTGYSSLSLLKRLPINKLKIDRSFIDDILYDKDDVAIVQAIVALGKSLKLDLIAEGVETEEQKNFLVNKGCTHMQGHYFSYPVFPEEIKEKWLNRQLS